MITHSELTRRLIEFKEQQLLATNAFVRDISKLASKGVVEEGGTYVPDGHVANNGVISAPVTDSVIIGKHFAEEAGIVARADQLKWGDFGFNSGFKFGPGSLKEAEGVDKDLIACTRLALRYSTQDFTIYDGIRSVKEQQTHVANGTSKTMQSKHLDGLAVDLVPWINGKPVWDWDGCYKIALAMDRAATEMGIAHRIVWGGAWDRTLADFGGNPESYRAEVEAYKKRHAGSDFIDGPHFEIRK